jgi:enterobactin synthetase component D / holo-[acyl-carrier protein] synthase
MKAITDLFSCAVQTAASVTRLADNEIYPEELAYIQRAVPKRRAEFATARILARNALAAIGAPPIALVPTADRAPVWPSGIVGSISHTSDYCAVVVGRSPPVYSVGLDIENLRVIDASMMKLILTEREQAWLGAQPPASRNDLAIVMFSCKEAYYKCQYPVSRGFLDFLDVELELEKAHGTFEARVLKAGWPARVAHLSGRFAIQSDKVFCGVELREGP